MITECGLHFLLMLLLPKQLKITSTVIIQLLHYTQLWLSHFNVNNKFKIEDVVNRWDYMIKKLQEVGITVVEISSAGDSRLMKAMRIKINIGIQI